MNKDDRLKKLSIIVPIAPHETAWEEAWNDLKALPDETQIVFSGPQKPETLLPLRVQWIHSELGRAKQLNAAAQAVTKEYLWFLHADSRFSPRTLPALKDALEHFPQAVHYFRLRFLSDGPPWMFLNEVGCWVRSRILGVPFGDQGFVVSKENFEKIGGFPERVPYGEDHLFVWRARQKRIRLRCTGASLYTSARRYAEVGWARLTWAYARQWTGQAWPEWKKLYEKTTHFRQIP